MSRVAGHKLACDGINSGKVDRCLFCGQAKPRTPKLVWPEYEAACRKVDHEPGTRWPATPERAK